LGHKARWEYFRAVYERYRQAGREAKQVMLNEFCLNTGYNRKYAIRLLNGPAPGKQAQRRPRGRRPRYGSQVLSVLAAIWEAAGYPWSIRLKALLPNWMPWIRKRYRLSPGMEKQLLGISARQMDRRLKAKKSERKRRIYGRTQPGSLLKHHIPVKTDSWDVTTPGFSEIDLVAHCGNSGQGEFVHSLNLTDIHTGWTETRAVLGKSEVRVQQALDEIEGVLPFPLLGVDSDNGSEFINWHLKKWCEQKQIQLTRGRPYKKDDNAHVEQKNWTHVRKLLGWERYDSPVAVPAINDLYQHELRLWLNLYLPSVKLVKKVRVGSKVRRVYDAAQTPLERVLRSAQVKQERLTELKRLRQSLDPFQLGKVIDQKLQRIYDLTNRRLSPKATAKSRSAQAKEKAQRNRPNGCGSLVTFSMSRRAAPGLHL
jgi:transposase InsO family protein